MMRKSSEVTLCRRCILGFVDGADLVARGVPYATPASAIIGTQRQRGHTGPTGPAGMGVVAGSERVAYSDGQLSASRGWHT